ncbi:MAG: AEC family transporter [Microthrixaceae bacterium]
MAAVALLLALAWAAGRWLTPPGELVRGIDWTILNLALPALVLRTVPDVTLGADAAVPVGVAWAVLVLGAAAVWVVARVVGWSRQLTGALMLVVPLGNTSFLGFPAVEALLGAQALPAAVLYDQLGTFLALSTYGAVVAGAYGAAETRPSAASIGRRVLAFPPFLALLAALALGWGQRRGVAMPGSVDDALQLLAATLTPLAMVSIGVRLASIRLSRPSAPVVFGLAFRLVALPAVVVAVALVAGASGPAWQASALEAAMPPMVTAGIVATSAGLDEKTVAQLVGVGLVLSLATLPLWAWLIGVTL